LQSILSLVMVIGLAAQLGHFQVVLRKLGACLVACDGYNARSASLPFTQWELCQVGIYDPLPGLLRRE
jgi:hypothetical protein